MDVGLEVIVNNLTGAEAYLLKGESWNSVTELAELLEGDRIPLDVTNTYWFLLKSKNTAPYFSMSYQVVHLLSWKDFAFKYCT